MKTRLVTLVFAIGSVLSDPARAADPVPGALWQATTQMAMPAIMPGKNTSMPPRIQQVCVANNSDRPPVALEKNCQMSDVTRSGATVRWKIHCTAQKLMDGEGELTFQAQDAYTGHIIMNMDKATTMDISGKLLGACDAGAAPSGTQ